MGVDYYFSGQFTITPHVSQQLRDEINDAYDPWQISENCDAIVTEDDEHRNCWDHDKDLARLVTLLTALGHALQGTIYGEISEEDAFWKYTIDGRTLLDHEGYKAYRPGVALKAGATHA